MNPPPRPQWAGSRVVLGLLAAAGVASLLIFAAVWTFFHYLPRPVTTVVAGDDSGPVAAQFGLPLYPGALTEWTTAGAMHFRTPDPPDRVLAFYRAQYPGATSDGGHLRQADGAVNFDISAAAAPAGTEITVAVVSPAPR